MRILVGIAWRSTPNGKADYDAGRAIAAVCQRGDMNSAGRGSEYMFLFALQGVF